MVSAEALKDTKCALKIAGNPKIPARTAGDLFVCPIKKCNVTVSSSGNIVGISKWFKAVGDCPFGISNDVIYHRN